MKLLSMKFVKFVKVERLFAIKMYEHSMSKIRFSNSIRQFVSLQIHKFVNLSIHKFAFEYVYESDEKGKPPI